MFSFQTALDNYLINYNIINIGNFEYTTIEGELRFVKINNTDIVLDCIIVKKDFRECGILTKFLKYIVDKQIENFWIVSVISNILYHYLLRFKYNGYHFELNKRGFKLVKDNIN